MDGTLVSWAVPKGPTLDPAAKRMAVHVEDHPLAYFDFEGVIPKGEYGGGDVIVWDWGTWEPSGTDDPRKAVEEGELHFDLHGEKLSGRFAIVRRGGDDRSWLLMHKRDEAAVPGWDAEQFPKSVKSGLDNDEVAAHGNDVWHRRRPTEEYPPPTADELADLDEAAEQQVGPVLDAPWPRAPAHQSRQGVVPRVEATPGGDQARADPVHGPDRAVDAPVSRGPPRQLQAPSRRRRQHGFWQKAFPPHAPEWMRRWRNDEADPGETEEYFVVEQPATLAFLANWGVLEIHAWTSTTDAPHQPTLGDDRHRPRDVDDVG